MSASPEWGPEPVTTLTLQPTSTWRGFRAGQFVQVGVEIDGARRTRCFSISSSQAAGDETFTVTVRAHADGLVSTYLATQASPGLVLHLSQAEGAFTLPDELPDRRLLLGTMPLRERAALDEDHRTTGARQRQRLGDFTRDTGPQAAGFLDAIMRNAAALEHAAEQLFKCLFGAGVVGRGFDQRTHHAAVTIVDFQYIQHRIG